MEQFKCEQCGGVFKSKAGLTAHKRSHKVDEPTKEVIEPTEEVLEVEVTNDMPEVKETIVEHSTHQETVSTSKAGEPSWINEDKARKIAKLKDAIKSCKDAYAKHLFEVELKELMR